MKLSHAPLFAVLIAAGLLPAKAQETIVDQLARERQEQTGTAITIIFDDSGSMNENQKLPQAKAAFTQWLKTIPGEYKLSLITFEKGGRVVIPLDENNSANISGTVGNLVAKSGTPICSALRLAFKQIQERRKKVTPYERQVVLLFTDGQETEDNRGAEGVRQTIKELRAANIEVAGVGFHGQGDYMDGVATHYYGASDEASLERGLAKIDAEIGNNTDLVVSNEELAEMKTMAPPPVPAETLPPPATTATPAPDSSKKKEFSPLVVFLMVVGFFILRSKLRKK